MSVRPRSGSAAEFFIQIPLRLIDALKRGDISGTGFQIVIFLAAECWRNEGVALYEIGQLQRVLDFKRSRDTFLRELRKLRPEWIDFELGERQRKAVEFRLTGAGVRQAHDTSVANDGADLRQSSAAVRQSTRDATPLARPDSEPSQLVQGGSRSGARREETREEEIRTDTRDAANCEQCGDEDATAWPTFGQVLCVRCGVERTTQKLSGGAA